MTGDPYPIKAWIVYGQNVLESIPQRERTLKAIEALDLMVVVDVLPVEQINYADLVLPEATYLERYDPPVVVTTAKQPFVSIRQPVCEPLYESKPGWWIAKQLASRMGLEAWFPWNTPDEHLDTIVEPMEINGRTLRSRGAVAFPGRPYIEDRTEDDGFIQTSSGKIELYSEELKDAGADPLPRYTEVDPPPAGYVRLIYGRAPVHSFARSQNNEALHALMPENEVWLHTTTAGEHRLAEGDRVVLENTDGGRSLPVRVKVTEGIRRDCAYLVHGFGQRGRGLRRASGRGASDTALMSRVKVDPLTGGTGMRVNFVRPVRGADDVTRRISGPVRDGDRPQDVRGVPRLHGGVQRGVGRPRGPGPHRGAHHARRRDVSVARVQRLRRAVQPVRSPALRGRLPLGRHAPDGIGHRLGGQERLYRLRVLRGGLPVRRAPPGPGDEEGRQVRLLPVSRRARAGTGLRRHVHRPRQVLRRPRGPRERGVAHGLRGGRPTDRDGRGRRRTECLLCGAGRRSWIWWRRRSRRARPGCRRPPPCGGARSSP